MNNNSCPRIGKYSTEGSFFGAKTCYTCGVRKSELKVGQTIDTVMYGFSSKAYALHCAFMGYLDADYTSEDPDTLLITSKNATKLKNKQKIYTIKLAEGFDQGIFNNDYGGKISKGSIVSSIEEDTLENLAKKYGIKYEIKNTPKEKESSRKQSILTLFKIATKLVKEVNVNGIYVYKDKEQILDFTSCKTDRVPFIGYDAWDGTNNNARDKEKYLEFMDKYEKFRKKVDTAIFQSELKGKIQDDGDWDEGYICYVEN